MSLVSMKDMLNSADQGGYAVGQFNLNNLEFTQAILQAAQAEHSPVILGVSEAYIPYMGGLPLIVSMVKNYMDHQGIDVPVALHLDHGSSFEICVKAIHAGFTSVMIDASHLSHADNVAVTRRVTDIAHTMGVSVEAELGRIIGKEDDLVVNDSEAMYADIEECVRLVRDTEVDCLAPALGSVHGPYRREPKLGFARMEEIHKRTGIPLVLHGGSGLPNDAIQTAISLGTAKINVNTDNQIVFSMAVRKILMSDTAEYDPRKYLGAGRNAVQEAVQMKMRQFGSAGKVKGAEVR